MFLEAQDLLLNSPWITNIEIQGGEKEKHTDTKCEFKVKEETQEIYPSPYDKYDTDVDNITDIHFTSDDLAGDKNDIQRVSNPKTAGYTSVIKKSGSRCPVNK